MNISLKESYKFGKDHPKTKSKFGNKNLKVKKSVLLKSPVFSLKSSYFAPNIIGASDENGNITIIDTNAKYKNSQYRSSNSTQSNNNNTLISSEIEPLTTKQLHSNTIFDFDWCFSDSKIISASGDAHCVVYDLQNQVPEYIFKGHSKSIKCIKQAFYNPYIFASCGRDGMILIWDVRDKAKRIDINTTTMLTNEAEFIYPIGGLKNFRSANQIKKKGQASSVVDTASTFTGIAFYNQTTLLSVESNEDDIKFWDTRKLLNVDELGLCKSQTIKLNKSRLQKFEEKNFLMSITQYTSFEIRYRELEDKLKLSSKHNSNNNNLFGKGAYPNEKKMNIIEEEAEEKEKNDYIWTDYNNNQQSSKGSNQNKSKKKSECSFDFLVYNKDIEEEKEARCLKEKLKEIKQKKNLKGLTSIFINREQRKILVNSMSNSQYVYDALFFDKTPPIEFKGHRSSFFVKSVLSPCGEFILSGSNDASIYTWSIPQNSVYSISGFHSQEINAVDWSRNYKNYIASASDDGIILIWDDILD